MASPKILQRPLNCYETNFVNQAFQNDQNGMPDQDRCFTVQANSCYGSVTSDTDAKPSNPLEPNNPFKRAFAWIKENAWILALVYNEFWISAAFSLVQPFFPVLASAKGLEAWKFGFVFSAFKFSMLIGSLCADKIMSVTSARTCYLLGQTGFFLFSVAFGCLYWAPPGNVLLWLAITLVLLGGFMNTLYLVCMFAVFTTHFRKHTGYVIALLEFLFGSGSTVGSAIGGRLIDLWAYPLPFFVVGATSMLSIPVILKIGSRVNFAQDTLSEDAEQVDVGVKYSRMLMDPVFLANVITAMLSWVILGFNEPTLEPSLREFNLSSTSIGKVYTAQFAFYSLGGITAGAASSFNKEEFYALFGQICCVLAYTFLGPAPFVPYVRTLTMVYVSQFFMGIGMAAQFVCGYSHALKLTIHRGYPDNLQTSGFVSSVICTSIVFGGMVMPPIAGYLSETYGYRPATMLMFGLLLAWVPVTFLLWLSSLRGSTKSWKVDSVQPK